MIEFKTLIVCILTILLYSLKWLLPKAISLYLKYKFHMNVKIGSAGLFSLQDIVFLKNGYSVHIDNIGFRSSFISSEVNKLVCLVARDVRIEKNIDWIGSTSAKKNKSNSKIENILPIVMKFAQFLAVHISRISIMSLQPNSPEWLFVVSVIDLHLDASVIGSSRQLLANVNAPHAEAKLLSHPMNPNSCCLAKITVNVCAESILDTHEPMSIQSLMLKLDKSKIVLNKGFYSFIQNNSFNSTLPKKYQKHDSLEMTASDIPLFIPPLIPKKIKIHLEELTILDVKENLVNEMKGELKFLTIDNLIIPDDKNHSFKQSNLSVKVSFENLSLIGQEETYISLEKCSFEVKYFKKSLRFDININNVYTLYSHDDIFQWYTSFTNQMLKPHQLKSTSTFPAEKLLTQNSHMDDISIDVLVQFLNVTATCKLGTECASVSFNKFKLKMSCDPVLKDKYYTKIFTNWPIGLCHRKWSSDLMLETVRCWLKQFSDNEYSPGMKKCHAWGTPLFIGLVLVQVKNSTPSNAPKLNTSLDIVRLEWSPPLAQFILRAHNSLQQIFAALDIKIKSESEQPDKEDEKCAISESIETNISVTNANMFLIADKKICILVRVDTIVVDIGTTRIICAIEGLKCDSLIPTKYHYVCTSSDDIKSWWLHIKVLKMEKIVKTQEILMEIKETFECRWSANVHLKLLTIFTDISDLKNHLGVDTIKEPKTSTCFDVKLYVKSKFKFSMKVSSAHYLLFSTEDLMYIKQNGKTRNLESKSFKVAVDQYNIFTVKGFKMLKTDFNSEVQAERQNSEGLTETNTIWDVAIENLKMVFPYGFEFYSIFQGEFFSIVKWLKLIHKKPKSQPEPLPSDIILKVQEFLFELSDDEFEVKLRDNYVLLEDEIKESLKRQKMLETKVSEVVKDRLLLPPGKVEELLSSLQKLIPQIYIKRSKQMKQQEPVRTRLFSWTMCDLCIIILADESMHGPQKVVNHICKMDADSLWPEDGLGFCILWCRMIFASCAEWKFQLRDFPQTWLDIRKLQLWGKLAGAEQEPTSRAKRSVTIELSDPYGDVTIERGMTSLKYYYDLNCEVDKYTYSFGPCWEPVIAQCKLCLEKVLGSSRDPSPPLPFWDKIRLIYHGRLTMIVNELKVKLHASLDPYNTTEEMELNWYNTAMDWTNAKFIFKGHLKVLVRTASKYDDVCLLNLPNLKLSIKLKWSCFGDPNDHYSVMPCAPDKLPEYSSNQEHDSFRAFRSQNLNVSLSIETKPESNIGSPHTDTDYPVALLYGSTLKWFENLKLILSGVTRPTRRGPLFNNNRQPKLTLSRHYRKVHLCVSLQHFQVHYWMSFALQRGFELFGQRISTSSEHTLNLVSNFEDDLKHRSRPVWSVGYMNCELMDTEIWLKSALQSEQEDEETEIKEKPVEKCYLLSVSKVSYGRESTTGTCDADNTPTPIHILTVYHLKGAWTTRNRDVAFALFNSLVKNQKLKKNLSTEALKGFCLNENGCTPLKNRTRNTETTEQSTPLSSVASSTCQASPSPMSKLQRGGQAATMLQQLISEVDNKPVVFSDDLSMQVTRERRLQGLSGCQQDDVLYKNWLISLINSQVLLKGCETKGYVIVSAAKAEILQRIHRPVWKDHSLVSKTTWVGTLDSMQYYATVSAGKTDFIDENIMWLNVENIQEKDIDSTVISDLPDLPHLVGSGHSVGGVVSETVGASNVGDNSPLQLQRIVSRCKCEFFYAGHGESSLNPAHLTEVPPPPTATPDVVGDPDLHEPVDAFTLMHHDLDVCTNSLQYAMILDVVNNLLLYVEPRRKEAYERLQRMRFQLQLQSSQDHRQPIQQLQNHVRCLVSKLRRLEKEIFLLKKEEDWQNEEELSSEIRNLEKQMNILKDQLNSESGELDMMVSCYKETQLRATQKLATLRGDKPSVVPSRANEICFKHAQWRLTENDGQLGIADLVLSNFLYTKSSKSDDSVEHLLELGYIRMTNLLANELYKEVIVPTEIQNNMPVDDRKRAVRIFCREKAPVGGISVKEHFEINVVPLTIGMTKKFYSTMMRFCFSERDPENIDVETDDKNASKGKKNKESNFYVPMEHKDDVEKMKERAEKNKLFIYIKIPEVPVKVSYKGNKEKNLEDIRDFSLVIPTIEYHNVTWTWLDLCQAMKTDSRRVILSQAIKHKLQINKTNKAIADGGASPQEEDKARMLFGSKLVHNENRYSKRGVLKFPK